jgi:uncharacterized membrane protein YgaE (UPF0421/DUF939 family)
MLMPVMHVRRVWVRVLDARVGVVVAMLAGDQPIVRVVVVAIVMAVHVLVQTDSCP